MSDQPTEIVDEPEDAGADHAVPADLLALYEELEAGGAVMAGDPRSSTEQVAERLG